MAFSRKQMAAAVAGTLSLAMLTGCPAAAPTGTGTPSPSAAPASPVASTPATPASPVASTPATPASPGASVDPGASPGTSPVPTSSAPAPSGKLVIVSGNIYDEEGATVDGALITVKSLDASVPYTATATSQAGSWVVNNVPEGANVEIVATKDGWTSRRRVGSFQQQATGRRNVINFGAAGGSADNDDEDPTGEAYFISDYPEIISTTPADEATDFDAGKISFKLTFSEPLTEESRENFEDVFAILPASDDSVTDGNASFVDLEAGEDNTSTDIRAADAFATNDYEYILREGDAFLGSSRTKMAATWNSEGTEVTFSFGGLLLSDDNDTAKYQMALIVENANDEIEDENSNQLGTPSSGLLDGQYVANDLIYNAFKEADLSINNASGASNTGDENWGYTHDTVSNFEAREDDTTPKLTSVDVTEEGDDQRIELAFSEPLAAFGGTGEASAIFDADLLDIRNYTFAVGERSGDVDNVELEGREEADVTNGVAINSTDILDVTAVGSAETNNANAKEEFFFATNTVVSTDQASDISDVTTTGIFIEIDEDNPTTLFIWIANRGTFFDNVNEIRARVENVADPAGNEIEEADADANVVEASI